MNHKHYRRLMSDSHNDHIDKNEELEKTSKNVKEQKKKLFGTNPQPAAGPKREKHMSQIQDFAMRRYGLKINPSGGKIDEKTGKRRSENPEVGVDKPDWRSGQLESQANPMAQTHELSHLELMPEGVDLPGGQRLMDKQYADIQRNYGYMQQKRSSHEIQPQAIENPIRQRAGLPKVTRDVPAKEGSPARMTVDTNEPAGIRLQRGKKLVDQAASSKLLNEQNKERLAQVDEGSLKYDPAKGWYKATNTDALINLRGRGKQEEAQSRLKSKTASTEATAAPAFDFNNLSADDQAAVQEFLNQRNSKLAASEMKKPNLPKSEDVSDPMGIGSMLKADKPVNPKDPVLGKDQQPKTVSDDYQIRMQKFLASKMKKADDENDPMIEDNLSTIRRKSNIIDDYVDSDDELPEWAKDKVTQAKTHMTDVMDYVGSDDMEKDEKPFKGYNKNKHARTGGLNDKERKRINRTEGRNLKRPVTGKVKAGSKAAKRRKSFCARFNGIKAPTSKDGKLTPLGAAKKRWKC